MDPNRLRSIEFFSQLGDDDLKKLATFATEQSVAEGTTLMRTGDYATEIVAIEEGEAEVRRGSEVVNKLGPGEVFGETGLLEKTKRNADVVAASPMRLVKLSQWEVKRLPDETVDRLRQLVEERHG
jgi:CRP/FNR family cyclic AMP-dependent transcriptional regulator